MGHALGGPPRQRPVCVPCHRKCSVPSAVFSQQVPVLNALRRRGVISDATRLVPAGYETTLQLVTADHRYYGFAIAAPKHEWPF